MSATISNIESIAVLLTCHNRKIQTLKCLESLYKSKKSCRSAFSMAVYLTDDGSTDGTSEAVKKHYPEVIIISGNGRLFWNGGMRRSWQEAQMRHYNAYLLLNDDVNLFLNLFDELFYTHGYCFTNYGIPGIYIGSLKDPQTNEHTYGGKVVLNRFTYSTQMVIPNGQVQQCQLGNGNIMLVPHNIVKSIGIFSDRYIHGKADYDFSFRAFRCKIPVLVCPNYLGFCPNDHPVIDLHKMKLKSRIQYLKSPKGIELKGYLHFMWRFFPWRVPFVYCSLWLQTLIPGFSVLVSRLLKRQAA